MTGPHLTPEREAEMREQAEVDGGWLASDGHWSVTVPNWGDVRLLLRALDAEREALNQARTALEASTADLAIIARDSARSDDPAFICAGGLADARVVANQIVLGLAVAEADKPHDGNER